MKESWARLQFEPGQRVVFIRNVPNDGSYPHALDGNFLVAEGDRGRVLKVGFQEEMHRVVYFVGFPPDRVIGCFEEDLVPATRTRSPLVGRSRGGQVRKGEGVGQNL